MQHTFNFYEDPGHGWLEVPVILLKEMGIEDQISPGSYMSGEFAYLEEDCDLSVFIVEAEKRGFIITTKRIYQENTPIRNMAIFRPN
jgi:hypothetical protein